MFYKIARFVTYILIRFLFRMEYDGLENLPTSGGFMVCSNHRTNLDPLFIAQKVKPQLFFMAKEELFSNWFAGMIIRGLGAFPVSRGSGDTTAIDYAMELVQSGKVLAMFPEGTRSTDGIPLRPKSGAALVAAKTKADIIPVAICFEGKLRFRSRITVRYGKLIPNGELGITTGAPREIKTASKKLMARITELLPPMLAAPAPTSSQQEEE